MGQRMLVAFFECAMGASAPRCSGEGPTEADWRAATWQRTPLREAMREDSLGRARGRFAAPQALGVAIVRLAAARGVPARSARGVNVRGPGRLCGSAVGLCDARAVTFVVRWPPGARPPSGGASLFTLWPGIVVRLGRQRCLVGVRGRGASSGSCDTWTFPVARCAPALWGALERRPCTHTHIHRGVREASERVLAALRDGYSAVMAAAPGLVGALVARARRVRRA